jgi:hypothetical protein
MFEGTTAHRFGASIADQSCRAGEPATCQAAGYMALLAAAFDAVLQLACDKAPRTVAISTR